jgi:proline iminopeptidase
MTEANSEGRLQVDEGLSLYYRTAGEGPLTVVVPNACWLAGDFESLVEGRKFVFYDVRGRGRSDPVISRTRLSMDHEISDLEALAQHLGLERFAIIGWSYLGGVAVLYALKYPDRIERIIQMGPVPPRKKLYYDQYMTNLSARLNPADLSRFKDMKQEGRDTEDPQGYCREAWRIMAAGMMADAKAFDRTKADFCRHKNEMPENVSFHLSQINESRGDWDWRPLLGQLNIPILIIHGDKDPIPMASAEEWAGYLPNAKLLAIHRAGHFPWLEQPDEFYPAVDAFLNGDWPDKAAAFQLEKGGAM